MSGDAKNELEAGLPTRLFDYGDYLRSVFLPAEKSEGVNSLVPSAMQRLQHQLNTHLGPMHDKQLHGNSVRKSGQRTLLPVYFWKQKTFTDENRMNYSSKLNAKKLELP